MAKTTPQHAPRSPNAIDIEVGARIRTRRKMMSMSQEKLGDAVGVTFQQIQKYEKGANRIGVSRLVQISDALGVTTGSLVDELSAASETPENKAVTFHNTNKAYHMTKAMSELGDGVQNCLIDLARALKPQQREQA